MPGEQMAANGNGKYQWQMANTNGNGKWQWQMAMANGNGKWQWQMAMATATANGKWLKWQMAMAMAMAIANGSSGQTMKEVGLAGIRWGEEGVVSTCSWCGYTRYCTYSPFPSPVIDLLREVSLPIACCYLG